MNVIEKGKQIADDLFDTPAFKLARSGDPSTSHDAADALDVNRMEKKVYYAICTFAEDGCIMDDVLHRLDHLRYSTITARFAALKEKGLIISDHRKRKGKSNRGQFVMWGKDFYKEEDNG